MISSKLCILIALVLIIPQANIAWSVEPSTEGIEYFERYIRPALVENCYSCHGGGDPKKVKGGYNLTFRDGIRKSSGDFGENINLTNPDESGIVQALRYTNQDFQMPPSGKLPELIVQYFTTWIAMGAPDPRDEAFKEGDSGLEDMWANTLEQRKNWWSYQPIVSPEVPAVDVAWTDNPIDAFIHDDWTQAGVHSSKVADPYTLIRRLSYVLTGLPPTQKEVDAFVVASAQDHQTAVEVTVDRLLASPRFGERWARHWMDWMRYTDSHGSENDPYIPHAWRYRDYLIRAFNADIPYDDLVREHLAGDLLPNPRINKELGIRESVLGIAQYRFVQHGYGPTDVLDEQVHFTDNQIDTISKAFLGSTVSCARCHNHKFDPISQTDFYAFYGIMASSRPATIVIDTEERLSLNKEALRSMKQEIRSMMATRWLSDADSLEGHLTTPNDHWKKMIEEAKEPKNPLHTWRQLGAKDDESFPKGWNDLVGKLSASQQALQQRVDTDYSIHWDLGSEDAAAWTHHGNGVDGTSAPSGAFTILPKGDHIIEHIFPSGVYTHLLSNKHSAVFSSPRFKVTTPDIYMRIIGERKSFSRYVMQNYPRTEAGIYVTKTMSGGKWGWHRWDMKYWAGEHAYLEMTTAPDQPVTVNYNETRSWFGVSEVIAVAKGQVSPKDEMAEFVAPLFGEGISLSTSAELRVRYAQSIRDCIVAWRDDTMTNAQARYLNEFLHYGLLTNTVGTVPELDVLVAEYRRLEDEIPIPIRAPGVLENKPFNQPLFTRGDHKKPEEPVQRRFLEAIDSTPYGDENSGRLALAESIVDAENPLAARVIANRLWHHTFGLGIVTTPDDFGAMGQPPSHPELLDYLAHQMKTEGWSMKEFIRRLVTSRTFQLSAIPTLTAVEQDPGNALFSHANIRRLESEAIRDSLLVAAGRLDLNPPKGHVLGNTHRRSVYVRVKRNDLDPFLTTFDAPVPVSTKGRRDTTNVATHSLTLMNDPFVRAQAKSLAELVKKDAGLKTSEERIAYVFERVIGRPPRDIEAKLLLDYVHQAEQRPAGAEYDVVLAAEITSLQVRRKVLDTEIQKRLAEALKKDPEFNKLSGDEQRKKVARAQWKEIGGIDHQLRTLNPQAGPPQPWVELAQSLFSLKEFTYLR